LQNNHWPVQTTNNTGTAKPPHFFTSPSIQENGAIGNYGSPPTCRPEKNLFHFAVQQKAPGRKDMSDQLTTSVRTILATTRTIAVVGLSPKEARPSHMVARYLLELGYTIIPVNPGQTEILGRPCYPDLRAVPDQVDLVNVFRRSETVDPVVEDAIAIGARAIWMQEGIINEKAAAAARAAGLAVIMDRCLKVDHAALLAGHSLRPRLVVIP
jgi:predicted CoA-binding protein